MKLRVDPKELREAAKRLGLATAGGGVAGAVVGRVAGDPWETPTARTQRGALEGAAVAGGASALWSAVHLGLDAAHPGSASVILPVAFGAMKAVKHTVKRQEQPSPYDAYLAQRLAQPGGTP